MENIICGCANLDTICEFSYSVDYENNMDAALEGCSEVCINFTLLNPLDSTGTTIPFGTAINTEAIEGIDFPILLDEVFFEPGQITAQVCFTPEADSETEGIEEAIFRIEDPCTDSVIFITVLIADVAVIGTEKTIFDGSYNL